jgi:Holliday junction resolvasome RuvABC endonuclease subunit
VLTTCNVTPQESLLLTAYGVADAVDAQWRKAIEANLVQPSDPFTVVVERPFVRMNIGVALNMGKLCGMIEATCDQTFGSQCRFEQVEPSRWQQALLHPKKGDDRKKLSKKVARKHYGIRRIIDDDEADAINIASYTRGRHAVGEDTAHASAET